ncbi:MULTISPECIES: hypothetical protein [unclassified Microbacterium]|uniref:hypothetical protein n=1 Tax=unclassified Microbacterium TaxID=2609290 RepID=UPI00386D9645
MLVLSTPTLSAVAAPSSSGVETAAAAARPARVGLVSFTGASLTASGATLTMTWPAVPKAQGYEVHASTSYAKAVPDGSPNASVTGTRATISGLKPGTDHYVAVRAWWKDAKGKVVYGPSAGRVGHSTISAQATLPASASKFSVVTWNICSNACSGFGTRAGVINRRIAEMKPGIVMMQEASKYKKAPAGYRFGYDGQADILYRAGEFSKVAAAKGKPTSGLSRFASKAATSGKGVAWAALKNRSGEYVVAFNAHLVVGGSAKAVAQREYEASRLGPYVNNVLAKLAKSHGSLTDWKKARVVISGDFNTHKSRTSEKSMKILEKAGWYDAYDESRKLTRQHYNSANPTRGTKPVIGVTWGDHVDKVLVRPSRSVVYGWANIGKMAKGRFVAPLGSDHHPVQVVLSVR